MLKIIIPLAGPSDLFTNTGYFYPKPLVEIDGSTMIEIVLKKPSEILEEKQFIFIIKEEDAIKFHLDNTLRLLSGNCEIIKLKKSAKGGLCSALMAADKINENDSILIMNGDQIIDFDFNSINNYWHQKEASAGIVTFTSVHPRWSYARIENDQVVQTAEKNPISKHSIAGYYYFKKASEFFEASYESIKNDVQLEGNYYISPILNQYILSNKKVLAFPIDASLYHSFYSPQMIAEYEKKRK